MQNSVSQDRHIKLSSKKPLQVKLKQGREANLRLFCIVFCFLLSNFLILLSKVKGVVHTDEQTTDRAKNSTKQKLCAP